MQGNDGIGDGVDGEDDAEEEQRDKEEKAIGVCCCCTGLLLIAAEAIPLAASSYVDVEVSDH